MRKLKVSMIGTLFPLKGVSAYCHELAASLSKLVDLEFITYRKLYPDFLYPGGSEDKSFNLDLPCDFEVRKTLSYYNPFSWLYAGFSFKGDILHVQWVTTYLAPVYWTIFLIAKLRGKPIVITAHNVLPHELSFLDRLLTKSVFCFADRIIVHSKENLAQASGSLGIPEKKLVVVPHGILSFYRDGKVTKRQARAHLGIPPGKKAILFFGIIRDYKGVDTLIESFSEVYRKNKNAILVIAGKPWVDWSPYDALIKKHDLSQNVKLFLDYIAQDEVKYFFEAADLVVLPYKKFPAQSGVGMLALPFHKPLIVTRVGGLPDLVEDPLCAVLPNNPKALATSIERAISSKNTLTRLAQSSKRLSKKYSWASVSKSTYSLYESLRTNG